MALEKKESTQQRTKRLLADASAMNEKKKTIGQIIDKLSDKYGLSPITIIRKLRMGELNSSDK